MKIFFMMLSVCFGGFLGYEINQSYKKRYDIFKELNEFLFLLKSTVETEAPFCKTLQAYPFKSALSKIILSNDLEFALKSFPHLKEEEKGEFLNFFNQLGREDRHKSLRQIDSFSAKISTLEKRSEDELKKKGKDGLKLGITIGILFAILMI